MSERERAARQLRGVPIELGRLANYDWINPRPSEEFKAACDASVARMDETAREWFVKHGPSYPDVAKASHDAYDAAEALERERQRRVGGE